MSNDDLMELWNLPGEIQLLQSEIKHVSGWRTASELRPLVAELLAILDQRLNCCQAEYSRCMDFIQTIPDEWTRTVSGFDMCSAVAGLWWGVEMGLTPDCCRQMAHRYLKRYGGSTPPP